MLKRRSFIAAASSTLVMMNISGAKAGGERVLSVANLGQDVGTLDPHRATGTIDRALISWMFNALVRFAPGTSDAGNILPDLAESWEQGPDGLVWTFKLRKGVKFHKGYGELSADDVVFSLRRSADAKTSAFAGEYAAIKSVDALDPLTVRITLAYRVPSIFAMLVNYSGGYIVCKAAVEKLGDGYGRNPIGTGPFAFDKTLPSQRTEVVGFTDYFRGSPKIDRVVYRYLPDASARDLAYQSGEVDLTYIPQDQRRVNQYQGLPETEIDVFGPGDLSQLYLNTSIAPLNNIRVRQAIAHAINRAEIAAWRGKVIAKEAKGIMLEGNLGFTADTDMQQYDQKKAKALLAEAGFASGLTLKVVQTQYTDLLALMQVLQAQLKRVGITLDLQLVEHTTWHKMIRDNLSSLVLYSASRFPIADVYLTQFFHSSAIVGKPTAITNFSHCDVADAEIEAARTELDPKRQLEYWAIAQCKIVDGVFAVPLIENLNAWARRKTVSYGFDLQSAMSAAPLLDNTAKIG